MPYVVTVGFFALAVLAQLLLDPWFDNRYLPIFLALVFAALYGGRRPALLVLALSVFAVLLVGRYGREGPPSYGALAVYLVVSLGVVLMVDRLRWAKQRAEERSRQAHAHEDALAHEVEQHRRTEAQVGELNRELQRRCGEAQALIEASPLPICWTVRSDPRRIECNAAFRQMLGVPEGTNISATGPRADDLPFRVYRDGRPVPPEELPMQRCVATGQAVSGEEFEIVRGDGERFTVIANAAPLLDGAKARGAVGELVDITERKKGERERAEIERRKDEFLAMLAHELRNPLAPIRNALAILQHEPRDAQRLPWAFKLIERQLHQLTRITDDLLDLANIVKGRIALREENVDFRTVIGRAIEISRPLIDARGHRLQVDLPEHEMQVNVDPARFAQVVSNLLTNAAKYTPKGGAISVSTKGDNGSVELRVRDTGQGIDQRLLPRIFDTFVQGDQAPAGVDGGLGLGLTIAKRITELHRGTITAYSAGRDQGSEFVIALPAAAGTAVREEVDAAPRAPTRRRVLIVDDNEDVADSVAVLLSLRGHDVEQHYDSERALEKAVAFNPEVVILDLSLPGKDGFALARLFRAHAALGECSLIAMSGYGQPSDRQKSAEAGFDCHLLKPVDPQVLFDVVEGTPATADPFGARDRSATEAQGKSPAA